MSPANRFWLASVRNHSNERPHGDSPLGAAAATISEKELYRAARGLIRRHGERAAHEAARKAQALMNERDRRGVAIWVRIVDIILDLQAKQLRPGAKPN